MIPNRTGMPAMALPFPRGWDPLPSRTLHVVETRPALPKGSVRASLEPVTPGGTGVDRWLAFPQGYPLTVWMAAFFWRGWPPFGIM